jgi:hypothetical protein
MACKPSGKSLPLDVPKILAPKIRPVDVPKIPVVLPHSVDVPKIPPRKSPRKSWMSRKSPRKSPVPEIPRKSPPEIPDSVDVTKISKILWPKILYCKSSAHPAGQFR